MPNVIPVADFVGDPTSGNAHSEMVITIMALSKLAESLRRVFHERDILGGQFPLH